MWNLELFCPKEIKFYFFVYEIFGNQATFASQTPIAQFVNPKTPVSSPDISKINQFHNKNIKYY